MADFKKCIPLIKYSGSLIQQNFGESLGTGILKWNTKNITTEFIPIENQYCYYTIEINNGIYDKMPDILINKKIRLRLKIINTPIDILNQIILELKIKYDIIETIIIYESKLLYDADIIHTNDILNNIVNIKDVENQNTIITDYIKNKYNISDDILFNDIKNINRNINISIAGKVDKINSIVDNIVNNNIKNNWKLKRFEFSNMFSYGEDNIIDFSNMNDVYGVFAHNASGKTSIINAISYCIYDKCANASRSFNVINNKANYFKCKLYFTYNNINYIIEKFAKRKEHKNNSLKVDINFYYINNDGEHISLNGKDRSETNSIIREILGTYEDFILSAVSLQNNNTNIIDLSQRDRKNLLYKLLNLDIFDALYREANEKYKELDILLKQYNKTEQIDIQAKCINEINLYENQLIDLQTKMEYNKAQLQDIDANIIITTSKLNPEILNIDLDINILQSQQIDINSKIEYINDKIKLINIDYNNILNIKSETILKLKLYDINEIIEKNKTKLNLKDIEKELFGEVERLKSESISKLDKMKKLRDLEYDENCSFCMNNIFVKDAIETKNSIDEYKLLVFEKINKLKDIREQLEELNKYDILYDEYDKFQKEIAQQNIDISKYENTLIQYKLKLQELNRELEINIDNINIYYKYESILQNNKLLSAELNILNITKTKIDTEYNKLLQDISSHNATINIYKSKKQISIDILDKISNLESQYNLYQYYISAVNRNGVPYDILKSVIPIIEQEVNNILSDCVNFKIIIDMYENDIDYYITYSEKDIWSIEMASGMEKFIASLSLKVSINSISNLITPNFLIIDEGLGVLDSNNIYSFITFLEHIKSKYDFIILISHMDISRDIVSNIIEVYKDVESNLSYINNQLHS